MPNVSSASNIGLPVSKSHPSHLPNAKLWILVALLCVTLTGMGMARYSIRDDWHAVLPFADSSLAYVAAIALSVVCYLVSYFNSWCESMGERRRKRRWLLLYVIELALLTAVVAAGGFFTAALLSVMQASFKPLPILRQFWGYMRVFGVVNFYAVVALFLFVRSGLVWLVSLLAAGELRWWLARLVKTAAQVCWLLIVAACLTFVVVIATAAHPRWFSGGWLDGLTVLVNTLVAARFHWLLGAILVFLIIRARLLDGIEARAANNSPYAAASRFFVLTRITGLVVTVVVLLFAVALFAVLADLSGPDYGHWLETTKAMLMELQANQFHWLVLGLIVIWALHQCDRYWQARHITRLWYKIAALLAVLIMAAALIAVFFHLYTATPLGLRFQVIQTSLERIVQAENAGTMVGFLIGVSLKILGTVAPAVIGLLVLLYILGAIFAESADTHPSSNLPGTQTKNPGARRGAANAGPDAFADATSVLPRQTAPRRATD